MNVHRASKATKAFWRASERWLSKAAAMPLLVVPANTPHHFEVERRRAYAAGWLAGKAWIRRSKRKERP
jgi:hypothetical protein